MTHWASAVSLPESAAAIHGDHRWRARRHGGASIELHHVISVHRVPVDSP